MIRVNCGIGLAVLASEWWWAECAALEAQMRELPDSSEAQRGSCRVD